MTVNQVIGTYANPILLSSLQDGVRLRDLEFFACPKCRRSARTPFVWQDGREGDTWFCVKCYVYWKYSKRENA